MGSFFKEITTYLGGPWQSVLGYIREAVRSDVPLLQQTNDGILAHGGKLVRPMTSLLTACAFSEGNPPDDACRYAAASEVLHNATLLHDDVADKSDIRRGEPTVNALLGGSAAVLVGDFWLARAMQILVGVSYAERTSNLFATILTDLAEGEMLQLQKAAGADTTSDDYYRIIKCKTASLFKAAIAAGAIAAGASDSQCDDALKFAEALGCAFQIKDDILDYEGGEEVGKPLGADIREQKITLPLLCAMDNSGRGEIIRQLVREIPQKPDNCEVIHRFVIENGGVASAAEKLDVYVDEAIAALETFPEGQAKEYLKQIARYNSIRKK